MAIKYTLEHYPSASVTKIWIYFGVGLFWVIAAFVCDFPAIATPVHSLTLASEVNQRQLPSHLAEAVIADLSQKTKVPSSQLQITQASPQTWSDGCLGLAQSDEFCTQILVEGWRIILSNGEQSWTYRTNGSGTVLRTEP